MTLSDFQSQYEMYKEFLYLFHKWETEAWRIKEAGPRNAVTFHFPSMEMDSFSLSNWPYTDSVFSCEGFFLLSFSQYLQILCKPWFVFNLFSCPLTWKLTALCLAGTMPIYTNPCLSDSKALEFSTLSTWVLSRCFLLNPCSLSHLNTLSVTLQHPPSVPCSALT